MKFIRNRKRFTNLSDDGHVAGILRKTTKKQTNNDLGETGLLVPHLAHADIISFSDLE